MTNAPIAGYRRSVLARSLALALALPMAFSAVAQEAQEAEEETTSGETTQLQAVEVVGSRIKRTEIEGPAPVTVITSAQIEAEGFNTVYDALSTLTQTTGFVQNELIQNGFTPNANVLNLRGLGPGRVLTLINGRRAADYPLPYDGQSNFVNLGTLPAAAVERIEVLAGGASAIYGSDAVAGVINVVLKTNYEGQYLSYLYGRPTRGGAPTNNIQWVGGNTGDNWSLTYAFEYFDRGALYASERDFMDSYFDDPTVPDADVNPPEGLLLFDGFTGNRLWEPGSTGEEVCGRFSEFDIYFFEASSVYTGPRCGYFGYPATQAIRNSDENISAYLYGTFDFEDGMQAFASLSLNDAEAAAASATQFWSFPNFLYDPAYDTLLQTQRIFTPSEVGGFGAQQTIFRESAIDFAAGLRGTAFDNRFDWKATYSHSEYTADNEQPRFLRQPLEDFFLGPQLGLDPFFNFYPVYDLNEDRYFNPISAADYLALSTIVRTDAKSESDQLSFELSGDLFEMPAGPLAFAAVVEAGSQSYDLDADPRIAPGQDVIYNLTGTGGGGERDRYAFGLEFAVPLHETFTLRPAARYDKYDDVTEVDDAVSYNLGLEWRPLENLLIRGSYATSFRAPDMHYVFADESGFFSGVFDEFKCRSDGFDPAAIPPQCTGLEYQYTAFGVRSGNTFLEEEEGESFTVGFVWDIIDGMSLTVDYYDIELEGIVDDISSGYILRNEAACRLGTDRDGNPVDGGSAFCQFILSSVERAIGGPNDGDITQVTAGPINRAFEAVNGIDASLTYSHDTDRFGSFRYQLSWSHVLEQEEQEFADEDIRSFRDNLQNFDFRSRMRGSVSWQYRDLDVTVFGLRYGSLPNWAETGRIAPYHVYNLNVGYRFTGNFRTSFIVNNVLDKLAPTDNTFNQYPYFWYAYSPIGREVFVQAEFNW